MSHKRRAFLKTVGAASIGTVAIASASGQTNAEEGFSPNDLDGLVGWYDAKDLSLKVGESVEEWADRSGAGNDASQDDTGSQPSYTDTGFAGIGPSVHFDGDNDYLWAPLGDGMLDTLHTGEVVALLDPATTEGVSHIWLASPDIEDQTSGTLSSSPHTVFFISDGVAEFGVGKDGENEDVVEGGVVDEGPNLLDAHWNEDELTLRAGGEDVASGAYEASGNPDNRTVIGAPAGGEERLLEGDIAELLFIDHELSADERQQLDAYLLDKWLPVTVQEPTDVAPTSATLHGAVSDLGGADSADVQFEYRTASDSEWTKTDTQTLEEPGEFSQEINGLSPQSNYGFRIVAESDTWERTTSLIGTFDTQVISLDGVTDVTTDSATANGEVYRLGEIDSAEVYIEYRKVPQADWTETENRQTIEEPGEFSIDVKGLEGRRYYEVRVVATTTDWEVTTESPLQFSTPSQSESNAQPNGPKSKAPFQPSDGFADPAPWLDDDTPVITITEPTREQLEAATSVDGPRIVAFETSGTVDLGAERLSITPDKLYLAGQTAPSPGITLIRGDVLVGGDDCVVQHIRVRPGDAGQDTGWEPDSIRTKDGSANNVIDHCTTTWSVDENLSPGYTTTNTTVSNCLIAEPLNDATHHKGTHGYNSLVGNDGKNVAFLGNIFAYATDRNPRLKEGTETVIVNNLVHHYHDGMWADPNTEHSIVGNVFQWPTEDKANIFGQGSVYAADNVLDWDADRQMIGDSITQLDEQPLWPDALEALSSSKVETQNLANAGARPADRTAQDERIIENVRTGGGSVIDSQEEVGGYPELAENTQSLDIPQAATRTWLRRLARQVEPHAAASGGNGKTKTGNGNPNGSDSGNNGASGGNGKAKQD